LTKVDTIEMTSETSKRLALVFRRAAFWVEVDREEEIR